ncbi:MAG: trehalose utilization protein ThuA [Mesorhizobium sp.]|uniref:ThuA domain-containing protein n=1 Tax=Mesorhizobium sp. TaxID=1871066 RepID=UPI000FE3F590|nr:ThuA domain-containing protein [Mesorhizobium sp.]RWJ04417.1 MAG: trehalose utilization protein ThuA [Mesorhizobium sp.]RWJ15180.1 MAG: trehalose utilization protein ThuA [Mesorhizobium sp.]
MTVNAIVWGENVHEQRDATVRQIYPDGMHNTIASALNADPAIRATTATLQEPEHGLTEKRLASSDVLLWWGHAAHSAVHDEIVDRVVKRVWEGMGLILLHSAHYSKLFKRLMGTPCALSFREAAERERVWVVNPRHPIAEGLDQHFTLENEEMYGEPFSVPEPLETVFISWFAGGEVFRSGLTYRRGAGNIFYFRPGHEAYPTYHDETVQKVLRNAVKWAHNPQSTYAGIHDTPHVPVEKALEPIVQREPKLHRAGLVGSE